MSESTESLLPRVLVNNLDRNVCTCYDVSKRQLIEAYMNGAVTFQELTQTTYACQGSGCCEKQVHKLIDVMGGVAEDALKSTVKK